MIRPAACCETDMLKHRVVLASPVMVLEGAPLAGFLAMAAECIH